MVNEVRDRRARTEAWLVAHGLPFHPLLHCDETTDAVLIRSAIEVARRAVILHYVVAAGHGHNRKDLWDTIVSFDIHGAVTSNERDLFQSDAPRSQDLVDATWRAESAWALLWSLGVVERLDLPDTCCDLRNIHSTHPFMDDPVGFITHAQLRPTWLILDEVDRSLRLHWLVREFNYVNHAPVPRNIVGAIVQERHHVLNWLIGHGDNWDCVDTAT